MQRVSKCYLAPKNIIFDLGGVLIDWNPRYLYRKIFGDEARMEDFLNNVTTQDWNEQQDAGRSFDDGINELLGKHAAYEKEIRAYKERWPEMLKGPITETVDILNELHANGVPLYALTNWSAETFQFARALFPFLKLFRDIAVSGDEMMKKPDPRFYQILLTRNNLVASECVFIDDSLKNVHAAETLGMHGIHFTSPIALKAQLIDLASNAP